MILPVLDDGVVKLKPFEGEKDLDYLLSLAAADNHTKITSDQLLINFCKGPSLAWTCWDSKIDIKGGVICLVKGAFGWELHAYKNNTLAKSVNNKASYSFRAAKLVLEYALGTIANSVYAILRVENRPAIWRCKTLGFKKDRVERGFMILKKEIELCH
jgi:hypothetical protein